MKIWVGNLFGVKEDLRDFYGENPQKKKKRTKKKEEKP